MVCECLVLPPAFSSVDTNELRKPNRFILSNVIAHCKKNTSEKIFCIYSLSIISIFIFCQIIKLLENFAFQPNALPNLKEVFGIYRTWRIYLQLFWKEFNSSKSQFLYEKFAKLEIDLEHLKNFIYSFVQTA